MRFQPMQWPLGYSLVLTLTVGCISGGPKSTTEGTGGVLSGTGGNQASAGASSATTEETSGGSTSSSTSSSTGGSNIVAAGTIAPPPSPPTADVPQPSGSVTTPNLRVVPWAGFKAAISYTFDDTQPSQMEHLAELEAFSVPMTFFANPSSNSRTGYDAAWSSAAAAGNELGNHTWTHCYSSLSGCTPIGTAEEEIDKATTYITSNLGVTAVLSFASPYGDTGWNKYASSRFLLGRGVNGGFVPASGQADWYNLPVIGVTAGQTVTNFDASIDSARSQGRWGIFMFHSILPTTNNWWAGVQLTDITASMTYVKSLTDVWVDTMGTIGAYARAQQMFEAVTPSANTWTWTLPEHFPTGGVLRVLVDGGTLTQGNTPLSWDPHGYYEVALDAGTLTWSP